MNKVRNLMSSVIFLVSVLPWVLAATGNGESSPPYAVWKTRDLALEVNSRGQVSALRDRSDQRNYLYRGIRTPLLRVKTDGQLKEPLSMVAHARGKGRYILNFSGGISVDLKVKSLERHLSLEITGVTAEHKVELVIWGPFPTLLNESVGETVGIVEGRKFAMTLQALNPKTLGGYPWKSNDTMPEMDIFEAAPEYEADDEGARYVLYRVEAAKPEPYGSRLHAYTRNRSLPRVISNDGYFRFAIPAFQDGGITGSKIALAGSLQSEILDTVGAIEVAEGLPHPVLDGIWAKKSPYANASYLLLPFGVDTLERATELTKKAGLSYLYHYPGPFTATGDSEISRQYFPEGISDIRRSVSYARESGITLGLHTLSGFLDFNAAMVTPEPDHRLAAVGSARLTRGISAGEAVLPLDSTEFFHNNQAENSAHKNIIRIGSELILCRNSSSLPSGWPEQCQRGYLRTRAMSHPAGAEAVRLADYAGQFLLADHGLAMEMSQKFAEVFNQTGLRQISFDGIEGNHATGLGAYGEILFTDEWYRNISDQIRSGFIADASRTSHYFWHMFTRMNWGEPWNAGFREGQTETRFLNQKFFKRNYIPAMLGWFQLRMDTSPEDIEWLLAKAAGYDAGFGLVTDFSVAEGHGKNDLLFQKISDWEHLRLAGAFSDAQKTVFQRTDREFTLHRSGSGRFLVSDVAVAHHEFSESTVPGGVFATMISGARSGEFGFIITLTRGQASGFSVSVNEREVADLRGEFSAGTRLRLTEGPYAEVLDRSWNTLARIPVSKPGLHLPAGEHQVLIRLRKNSQEGAVAVRFKLETRIKGEPEEIRQINRDQASSH